MNQDELKKAVAKAAFEYVSDRLVKGMIIGIGTGSTANYFIEELAAVKDDLGGTVASSEESARRLQALGIEVFDLNAVGPIGIYIDGADESNADLELIKGGGAALTREKIIAATATEFVCIADESKLVNVLGKFPLPVEVIPMARSHVARQIVELGGDPVWREGCVTDNGNQIIDVHNLQITKPQELETALNAIVGVVCNGLFAQRGADRLFLGTSSGVETHLPRDQP